MRRAYSKFPISFHSTGFTGERKPDTEETAKEFNLQHRCFRAVLFQLDGAEVLVSLIASGACEKYPDFRSLNFSMKPSDYFRRNGMTTCQQEGCVADVVHLVGEDNIMWATDCPHADCLFPDSLATTQSNLGGLPEGIRRKITCGNAVALYNLS